MKQVAIFLLFSICSITYSQNDNYIDRLQAVINSNAIFYNVDGIDITSKSFNSKFNEKDLKKILRTYKIKNKDPKSTDSQLGLNNYVYDKSETFTDHLKLNVIYYVLDNTTKVTIISFAYTKERDLFFERQFINDFLTEQIPKETFVSSTVDSIKFAGRKISLGGNCRWMNVRNVQCPYYGQMNWSIHEDIEDAKESVEHQFLITKHKKGGKVISESSVPIIFEGKETIAKSAVYDVTGVNSLLVGLSGAETLTIYYVAEELRGQFVSCVLSFWNNDEINESGLPALLEEVMSLKD
ncbi:hypothetical protein [Psychroserpens damuponensis]|uniref:hypothetical protein n=1 Tax=Psychroserpens damuponensis TaxID=943936 RepID=UPI00058B0DDC|nr:hypothetical protein [Psychroserpens damuponensis]